MIIQKFIKSVKALIHHYSTAEPSYADIIFMALYIKYQVTTHSKDEWLLAVCLNREIGLFRYR